MKCLVLTEAYRNYEISPYLFMCALNDVEVYPRTWFIRQLQRTPLIVATSRPAFSGHNNRRVLYPGVFL